MWDERYAGTDYFYGKEPNDFLKESVAHIKPGDKVLCLAEGEGRNAVYIATTYPTASVMAVDASKVGLEKTQQLAQEKDAHVETLLADLNDFTLGNAQWDVIVSIWCHLPSALRKKVHTDIVKALKPGGLLILEAYTPAQLKHGTGGPKAPDMLMQLAELKQELTGLTFVVGQEIERDVREGQGHHGQSAVVQVMAEKVS
ncbi:MAG: class I SAM-dependent methyltransferase [Betaproteobacteria bacterium]|nr:class I SAM-dependent methyltransferase [Betaproteobacteria bacterium]